MPRFGKYDDGELDQKTSESMGKAEEILGGPGLSPFVFTLASLVFNGEYWGFVTDGEWWMVILFPFLVWFGFCLFKAVVLALFATLVVGKPWFEKLGRWRGAFAVAFSVICFLVIHFVGVYVSTGKWH